MHVLLSAKCLTVMMSVSFTLVSGAMPCHDSLDCARKNLVGYTCQNLRCVCDPTTDTGLFSCRVLSSLNGMETHSSLGLSPSSSFPLHPIPCVGLFLPSGSLAAAAAASTMAPTMSPPPYEEAVSPPPYEEALAPPPYEEALKHNIILSSFPSATTVILPTAPPIQGPPNTMPGGAFMCNSQGGLT